MQHTEKWTARNVSSKSIVTVVETLHAHYPNGSNTVSNFEYELFFHPQLLMPGEDFEFNSIVPDMSTQSLVTESSRPASSEVIVRWVQFSDGTSFGDPTYAANILGTRAETLKQLKRLHATYSTDGAEQFAAQLLQKTDTAADGFLEHLRMLLGRQGTQAAIDALEGHLQAAESRSGRLLLP